MYTYTKSKQWKHKLTVERREKISSKLMNFPNSFIVYETNSLIKENVSNTLYEINNIENV